MRLVNPPHILICVIVVGVTSCSSEKSQPSTAPSSDTTSTVAYNIAADTTTTSDSAVVVVGSTIPIRVVVTRAGLGVSGISVAWTVSTGHGVLSSSASTTDSLGFAAVSWTVGDTAGLNSLTAAISGASVTLRAAGVAGSAATLMRVSDDSLWVVGGALTLLTARTLDRYGNVVGGARVTWTASDGLLSTTESITGASGNAETAFTAPIASGTSTITATLAGKASIRFRVFSVY